MTWVQPASLYSSIAAMQSSGVPDCIQLSPTTYELLQGKFNMTSRGTVACKGMGDVSTYLLGGPVTQQERVLAT